MSRFCVVDNSSRRGAFTGVLGTLPISIMRRDVAEKAAAAPSASKLNRVGQMVRSEDARGAPPKTPRHAIWLRLWRPRSRREGLGEFWRHWSSTCLANPPNPAPINSEPCVPERAGPAPAPRGRRARAAPPRRGEGAVGLQGRVTYDLCQVPQAAAWQSDSNPPHRCHQGRSAAPTPRDKQKTP